MIQKYEYNGNMLSIRAIARAESISPDSLKRKLDESGDIYEAVRMAKESQAKRRGTVEYNGQLLTVGTIAKREGLDDDALRRRYNETKDIYEAIRLTRKAQIKRKGTIKYKGKTLTLTEIASMEGVSYISLKSSYEKLGDIYEAINMAKSRQTGARQLIEYKGEMQTLNSIANIEGIRWNTLKRKFELYGDIYKAVEVTKASQKSRNGSIEYKGKKMTLNEIAKLEGLTRNSLQKYYERYGNIGKAILIARLNQKRNKRNSVSDETEDRRVDLYSTSIMLGISYNELKKQLEAGASHNELIGKYHKKGMKRRRKEKHYCR